MAFMSNIMLPKTPFSQSAGPSFCFSYIKHLGKILTLVKGIDTGWQKKYSQSFSNTFHNLEAKQDIDHKTHTHLTAL